MADGFEEIEAVTPIDLLRRAGVRVVVAGLAGLVPVGRSGVGFQCDVLLVDVQGPFDAVVLPGGQPGARNLSESPLLATLLETAVAEGWLVAAVCAAPAMVLGSLGWLKGRRYTGYPGTANPGPPGVYIDSPVVEDGRLLTSQGVGTAAAFALKLVERLAGAEKAAEVARATLLA